MHKTVQMLIKGRQGMWQGEVTELKKFVHLNSPSAPVVIEHLTCSI